mgnify:CR=1 FL=1
MITLKTLSQATAQEVFDQVARHLLTQGKKSISENNQYCMYRGFNGTKCAAGCLIADDEYRSEFEIKTWAELVMGGYVVSKNHYVLIMKLQSVHDEYNIEDWKSILNRLAEESDLKPIDF